MKVSAFSRGASKKASGGFRLTGPDSNSLLSDRLCELPEERRNVALGHLGVNQVPVGLLRVGREGEIRREGDEEAGKEGWDPGEDAEATLQADDRLATDELSKSVLLLRLDHRESRVDV